MALSPAGNLLYVGSMAGAIVVIDTLTDRVLPQMIETSGPVMSLSMTPDGKKLFIAMSQQGLARLLIAAGKMEQITDRICVEHVRVDPRGKNLYVSYQCDGPSGRAGHDALEVFDIATEKSIGIVSGPPNGRG
jgi:WD40 repeat protein